MYVCIARGIDLGTSPPVAGTVFQNDWGCYSQQILQLWQWGWRKKSVSFLPPASAAYVHAPLDSCGRTFYRFWKSTPELIRTFLLKMSGSDPQRNGFQYNHEPAADGNLFCTGRSHPNEV